MVLPILQLVQRREQQALWKLRQKLGMPSHRKGHKKVDVSAMPHRTHECTKERVQNLRSTKKGPNHPKKRDKRVAHKAEQLKRTNSELWSLIEAESNKIEATPANPTTIQRGDKDQTNANTDTADATPQDHSDTVSTCATSADTQQTALKHRNQIPSDIKKYEAMSFSRMASKGASLKAEAVPKLRTELEQAQQDLSQPLPRNIYVRKDKEAKAIKAGVEHQHDKESESDGHEAEARERNQRYQEAAGGSGGRTRPCVQPDESGASQRHEPRDCRPVDHRRSLERGSNQANCRHFTLPKSLLQKQR